MPAIRVSEETRDAVNALVGKFGKNVDEVVTFLLAFHEESPILPKGDRP